MKDLFFDNRIAGLIYKYLQKDISEAEYQELQTWVNSSDRASEIFDELTSEHKLPGEYANYLFFRKRVLEKIHAADQGTSVVVEMKKGFRWNAWLSAAVVVSVVVGGFSLLIDKKAAKQSVVVNQDTVTNVVPPGKDGAILTLADGGSIVIDELKDGEVARQGNVSVVKDSGTLRYRSYQFGGSGSEYNLLSTPRGRIYRVELPDGSIVNLNAASSLHFPTVFGNDERRVTLTGEAYFEVAKDDSKKFVVIGPGMTIEALGTQFTINSYEDEPDVKVTLIEGSIRVNKEKSSVILKPGQQASMSQKSFSSQSITVSTADVEQEMAWKNGLFIFQKATVDEMMRQFARWYDVEIVIEDTVKDGRTISGLINRKMNAAEALKIFNSLGYNFTITGKKIIVKL
jgi:transmembrane sensor